MELGQANFYSFFLVVARHLRTLWRDTSSQGKDRAGRLRTTSTAVQDDIRANLPHPELMPPMRGATASADLERQSYREKIDRV